MIEVRNLTKSYGGRPAVTDLTFTAAPGRVTGFLGPNGAGKSTTMRLIVGLDRPDSGTATIGGRPYRSLRSPLAAVGALLETDAAHPGRSGRDHLRWLAQTQGLPVRRVDEVLDLVDLAGAARRRVKEYSLGMRQRLGIAAALLGDPRVLLLDEPVNGLDPAGVRWVRDMTTALAAEGRTVFVSSHLMAEVALTAGHLVVIARGRLVADCSTREFLDRHAPAAVRVRTPDPDGLTAAATRAGGTVRGADGALVVSGLPAEKLADVAAAAGIAVWELSPVASALEDAFLEVTS